MPLELDQLPGDTESLKKIIFSLQQQNDHLQEMVRLLQNEIFGPILPLKTYKRIDEVIDYINANPRPLGLYQKCHASIKGVKD